MDEEDLIKDINDCTHYNNLRSQHVTVDGKTYPHRFFEDDHDIALGMSTDGFGPFRRRKKTCWPIILSNYNLPPELCFCSNIYYALAWFQAPTNRSISTLSFGLC